MNRKLLIPALVSVSLAAGATVAQAGTVFDFIPRMDFMAQPELVTKDKSKTIYVCNASSSESETCSVAIKSVVSKITKTPKK